MRRTFQIKPPRSSRPANDCRLSAALSLSSDFYENSALMLEEEGAVIVGLLVGLNVIDANLCVKGEDLDSQVTTALRRQR